MMIQNAVALVTGANRGIGLEIVAALLAAGARKIYAGARNPESLGATCALDRARVEPLALDVARPGSIDAAARAAPDVTLLVNNAGVIASGSFLEVSLGEVERQFAVNFYGKLNMARAFAPLIAARGGGAIVNMLTFVALVSAPRISAYNASKAAAWSMTLSLRATLAPQHIEVFGVFPGAIDTDMMAGVEVPKTHPAVVARAIVAGVEAGQEDIFPDPMSAHWYEIWRHDHKAVERAFFEM